MNKRASLLLIVLIIAIFTVSSYFIVFQNLNVFSGKAVDDAYSSPTPKCGDNVTNGHEQCDGKDNSNCADAQVCNNLCECEDIPLLTPFCGNNLVDEGEECDDGNLASGDGCSSECKYEKEECGNGIIDSNEYCDENIWKMLPENGAKCASDNDCSNKLGKCIINNELPKICTTGIVTGGVISQVQQSIFSKIINFVKSIFNKNKEILCDSNSNTKLCESRGGECILQGTCEYTEVSCTTNEKPFQSLTCEHVETEECTLDCKEKENNCNDGCYLDTFIDSLSIDVEYNGETYTTNVDGSRFSSGEVTGTFTGIIQKRKLFGTTTITITINYKFADGKVSKTKIIVDINGKEHYELESACALKQGGYSLKGYEAQSNQIVESGKTIKLNIKTDPCPIVECNTNEECWDKLKQSGECLVCKKPNEGSDKKVCIFENYVDECKKCGDRKAQPQLLNYIDGCTTCDGKNEKYSYLSIDSSCTTNKINPGICKKSKSSPEKTICVEQNCESYHGEGFISCPEGTKDCEKCCPQEHFCCKQAKEKQAICCSSNIFDRCEIALAPNGDPLGNICHLKACPSNKPLGPFEPPKDIIKKNEKGKISILEKNAFNTPFCCKEDEKPGSQSTESVLISLRYNTQVMLPSCVKEKCDADEPACSFGSKILDVSGKQAVICCDKDETPANLGYGLCVCVKKQCKQGEKLCKGIKDAEGKMNICCNQDKPYCTHSENGFPYCVKQIEFFAS